MTKMDQRWNQLYLRLRIAIASCLLTLSFLLCCLPGFTQKYNFINFNVENGLAQSQASAFAQNKNNELLIGTYGGLSVFDGSNFSNYTKSKGLPQNVIYSLACDQQQNFWIGSSNSISRFDGKKITTYLPEAATEINQIEQIVVDAQNTVWAIANTRLYRFDGHTFTQDKSIDTVTAITLDKEGKLWAAGLFQGVFVHNGSSWHREIDTRNDRFFIIGKLFFGKYTGLLYALTSKGLMVFDKGKFTPPSWLATLPYRGFADNLLEDSKGNIWLSYNDGGAWAYSSGKWTHYTYQNGLTDDNINAFYEDAEGNIWFATNGSGIYRYTGSIFTYYDRQSGLATPSVMSVAQNRKGAIFFASNNSGLYKLNQGVPERMNLPAGASRINSLLSDSAGKLWIGTTDNGLWTLDGQHVAEFNPKFNGNVGITHLYRDGNSIWVSSQTGLYRLRNDSLIREHIARSSIFASIVIGTDSLLVGTIKGAYVYRTDLRKLLPVPLLANATTLCFATDNKNIYIGTDDRGVVIWNKKNRQFSSIDQRSGLSCNYVYSLLNDRDGNLWVGTGCGIDRVSFPEGGKTKIKSFGKSDGLLGVESNANASFEDREGFLWFGTTRGVFRYNPYVTFDEQQAPKVILQSVKLYSKDIPGGKYADSLIPFTDLPWNPVLPTSQNHLTFTFKGVYLSNPEKIRYRYQLVGIDKSYTETDQNTVVYPTLPPGEYLFKVWASDAEGNWYDNAVVYPFIINTPYYTTWYFRLGIGLLLAGLFLAGVYYRNRQREMRRRWEEKLKEEQQALVRQKTAEDFHDEIGNKLTRINLLATIAEGKLAQPGADVKSILHQIQTNVTSLYNGSKDIIWSLQPESDYMDEIIFRIRQNTLELIEGTGIQFEYRENEDIVTHVKLPIDHSRNLIMIFKEAVNNIVKHAHADTITFSVTGLAGKMVFELADNGIGFDEAAITRGNGLGNLRNRAQRIGAELQYVSQPGNGTQIKLLFRIHK